MNIVTSAFKVFSNTLGKINEILGVCLGAILAINIIVSVLFRYLLNMPIYWADELSLYLLCWLTFIGGGIAIKNSEMASVTLVADRLPDHLKWVNDMIIQILIIGFSVFILYYSYYLITSPSVLNRNSPTLPVKQWVLYLIIPFSMISIIIFSIHTIIDTFNKLLSEKEGESTK